MGRPTLHGRSILIVEDEPLIAFDLAQAFENAGAEIVVTYTLHHALVLVEHDGLSAAVLDHPLHRRQGTAHRSANGFTSGNCRS